MLFLSLSALWARPNEEVLRAQLERYNELTELDVPVLTKEQRMELSQGEVVKLIQRGDSSSGGVEAGKVRAYYVTELPKAQLWLAFQDAHFQVQEMTTDYLYASHTQDKLDWYGFIDLFWPLSDRHWLVRVWNTHEIAQKSNNEIWEHPWALIDNGVELMRPRIQKGLVKGIDSSMFEQAIYVPASNGTWVAMDVEGHTLLIYSATATVGGSIPEELMMRYLLSGLDTFILEGEARARKTMIEHYVDPHPPIYGGDGKPIPLY